MPTRANRTNPRLQMRRKSAAHFLVSMQKEATVSVASYRVYYSTNKNRCKDEKKVKKLNNFP